MHGWSAQLQIAVVAEGEEDTGGEEEVAKPRITETTAQNAPRAAAESVSRLADVLRFLSCLRLLVVPAFGLSCQLGTRYFRADQSHSPGCRVRARRVPEREAGRQ